MDEVWNLFSWKKELETGIEIVDSQHKEFLKHANKFLIKVRAGKIDEGIEEEFEFVRHYLLYHFQAEETFLLDSGYEDYKKHQAEHLELKFRAKEAELRICNAKGEEVIKEFASFINSWVIQHILKSDLLFASYYKDKCI